MTTLAPTLVKPAASPAAGLQDGALLAGIYRIRRRLGQGGMGAVYLAHHERWGVDVAVKVPSPEILADPAHAHRIRREAEAWTELGLHPHVAYCYYVHLVDGVPFLVVEYIAGGSLRDWIAGMKCAELRTALDLAIQFCHGLEHAHSRGLVHRDVKPENILLTPDGNLKITDFGITGIRPEAGAPPAPAEAAGRTVGAIGTYEYMAPEQFLDAHQADPSTDIFAFGVCLYEMLCGARPYAIAAGERREPPEPARLRNDPAFPPLLAGLMKRAVEWERRNRPRSAAEVRAELNDLYRQLFHAPSLWEELPVAPLEADGWNNRGVSYLELGREPDAARCFAQALAADPNHREAARNSLLLEWRAGRISDQDVISRLELLQDSEALAEVHLERHDPERARAARRDAPAGEVSAFTSRQFPSQHPGGAAAVALTADARFALTAGTDKLARSWDLTTTTCLRTLAGHTADIRACALTPDGRLALTGGLDQTLRIWDPATGACLQTIETPAKVLAATLSPDGMLGVSGGWGGWRLWDLQTGQCLRHAASPPCVNAFALAEGQRLLLGASDGAIEWWDLGRFECLLRIQAHAADVSALAVTPDGRFALSAGRDRLAKVWDLRSGSCLRTSELAGLCGRSVALTSDGRWALSAGGGCCLWETATGRCLRTLHPVAANSVALSADGRTALLAAGFGPLQLWQLDLSRPYRAASRPSRPRPFAEIHARRREKLAAIEQAERQIFLGRSREAADGLFSIWAKHAFAPDAVIEQVYACLRDRARTGAPLAMNLQFTSGRLSAPPGALVIGHSGQFALTAGDSPEVRQWELAAGRSRVLGKQRDLVWALALSPDGAFALSAGSLGLWKVWSLATGACVASSPERTSAAAGVRAAHFLSLTQAVVGRKDGRIAVWDLAAGQCLREWEAHPAAIAWLALSAGAGALLSGGGNLVRHWDPSSGRMLHQIQLPNAPDLPGALTPDGRQALLAADLKGTLALYDLESGAQQRTFTGHQQHVCALALSPDGRRAVSASADRTVRFWDLQSGECLYHRALSNQAFKLAWSPDAASLLVSHWDGSLSYWRLVWGLDFEGGNQS